MAVRRKAASPSRSRCRPLGGAGELQGCSQPTQPVAWAEKGNRARPGRSRGWTLGIGDREGHCWREPPA